MWNQENRNYKILIVQQNEENTNAIATSLARYGFADTRATHDFSTALGLVRIWHPDFVLLDTHLEGSLQGLELARQLTEIYQIPFIYICGKLEVHLTTEIVGTKPSGILLHPLNELQFIITLNRLIEFNSDKQSSLMDLKNKGLIKQEEIMYLQAYGNYWEVITNNGKKLVRKSYSQIISSFPENQLQRIHRSYIVNRNAVTKYSSCKVQLVNGLTLPISRSFQQELRNIG